MKSKELQVEEELRILKAKLELLDALNDKSNYLDYEILNSDGFFRRSELEGLFDEALLENYDYREERC